MERAAAQQALLQLATVGARVVGAVPNYPDAKVAAYGGQLRMDDDGSKPQFI